MKKTAFVFRNKSAESDILIPYSVEYDSSEYIITKILHDSFYNCNKIKTVKFHSNSQLKTIEKKAFERSSIEKFQFQIMSLKSQEVLFVIVNNLKSLKFLKIQI